MTSDPLPREAALVVNAHSRSGQDLFAKARELLEGAGVKLLAAHAVTDPAKLAETVRGVVLAGAPMAIVGGGDGSLSGTIDELIGTDCVFGVLPLGTANSFARSLGLPLDLPGAVDSVANGVRRRVDVGLIDGDYFVNGAAIGLPPMIGETVPHNLKRYLGRVGYLLWALQCSMRFKAFRLTVDDGDTRREMWSTEVRILNGTHHGGVQLSDDGDVASGEILIQAVVGRSKARLAADWYAKFFRLRDRHVHTEEFSGKAFRIETRPILKVSVDGEVIANTPLRASVAPGAIEVAVPR